MKNRLAKILVLLTVVVTLVAAMTLSASAVAVTGVSGVEVTVDSNGSISESGGTVTVTAKGSFTAAKKATVTVKNTSGSTATITFDYTASNVSACSLGTVSSYKCSGTKSVLLTADSTTTFTITSRSFTTSTTATIKLSSFKVETAAAESDITVTYGSLGSVKLDGTAITSGSVNKVSSATGGSFVAVPGSGSKFVAWINPSNNTVISTSATYQLIPTEAMSIRAVFAKASAEPVFFADGIAKVFEGLDAALTYASSASNKTITLASDATLAAGNYTIPAGITLNIPYNAAGTLCTTKPTVHSNAYTTPSVFRTLNMASGANLTVNGALSLSAQVSSKYGHNGMPSGALPFIKMAANSKITVENGAAMYVYGFITGSGSVEIKSGGTVYECFQIADYRGGDATTAIASKDDEYGVFPFNQYYIQNVEVPMTIYAGAKEMGYTCVTVTLAGDQDSDVPFIGPDNSMFVLDSGYVVKDYIEGTGRTDVKIYGDVSVATMTMSMKVSLIGEVKIDSSKYALPIAQHLTISVESGNISLDQSVSFLPGSELYIKEGANCYLGSGKKIVVYDLDQWLYNNGANGYSGTTNLPYVKTKYVPGGDGIVGRQKDALVQVDGYIDATAGSVYATSGGANIYSTGTGKIKLNPGTETKIYQVITNDTNISSWPEIALIPGVLTDADGSTVSADVAGEYIYYASTGKWDKPGHRYEATVTAPTCTEKGYTTHTCVACLTSYTDTEVAALGHKYESVVTDPDCENGGYTTHTCSVCNHSYTDSETESLGHDATLVPGKAADCTNTGLTDGWYCNRCQTMIEAQQEIPALGHNEVTDAAVAATCENPGKTEGKHCDRCGKVLVAQEEVAALGHKYEKEVTAPTCTEDGYTTYTCSTCGSSHIGDPVKATGHTEVTDAAVAATCTTAGKTEGKHCSVCNAVLVAQEEVKALGHTEVTDAAVAATCTTAGKTEGKHCSVCNAVLVAQEEVKALGHTEVTDAAVAATCTTAGKTEGKHCSVCNAVLVAQEEVKALGHTEVTDAAVAATCTTAGKTEGRHCSVCNAVLVAQEEVKALGHTEVTDAAVAATCTTAGKTEGKHCSVCNAVLVAQEEVKALGHNYVDGKCTACGAADPDYEAPVVLPTAKLRFSNVNIRLEADLTISFGVKPEVFAEGAYENPRVVYSIPDILSGTVRTQEVTEFTYNSQGRLMFAFNGISPRMMKAPITCMLYGTYQGVEYSYEYSYQLSNYCYGQLNNKDNASNTMFLTLLADLLNFGTAHQKYANHELDNLINAEMTETHQSYASKYDLALTDLQTTKYEVIDNPTTRFASIGLSLQNAVVIRYTMQCDDITDASLKVIVEEKDGKLLEYDIPASEWVPVENSTNRYTYEFSKLMAKHMSCAVYAKMCKGDVATSNTFRYSIETYACRTLADTKADADLKNLLTYMMYYGNSAAAYFTN